MCQICKLLESSFPSAKQMARVLMLENPTVDDKHEEELSQLLVKKINEQFKTPEEGLDYLYEYTREVERLEKLN